QPRTDHDQRDLAGRHQYIQPLLHPLRKLLFHRISGAHEWDWMSRCGGRGPRIASAAVGARGGFCHGSPLSAWVRLRSSHRRGSCPMKHPLALALAVALTTSLAACSQTEANPAEPSQSASQDGNTVNESSNNPFFAESSLPLHYPAFDKITDADFRSEER